MLFYIRFTLYSGKSGKLCWFTSLEKAQDCLIVLSGRSDVLEVAIYTEHGGGITLAIVKEDALFQLMKQSPGALL